MAARRFPLRLLALLALLALVFSFAIPAAAQTPIASEELPATVVTQRKTVIDFSQVDIVGELTHPDGSYSLVRGETRFRNLIELRGNFRPELARSASKLP